MRLFVLCNRRNRQVEMCQFFLRFLTRRLVKNEEAGLWAEQFPSGHRALNLYVKMDVFLWIKQISSKNPVFYGDFDVHH